MAVKQRKRKKQVEPDATVAAINKEFGEGTIRRASDPYFNIERIPTGVLSLDHVLGGGLARGRHVEIYGSYSVGKTTCAYRTIASAQKLGLKCAFMDAERTFDPEFAAHAGVDLETLVLPERQEHGHRIIDLMVRLLQSGDYGVIALDSIASLLPKKEAEGDIEDADMGTHQARLMSKALRKLTTANSKTVLIYLNQLRDSIGVMFGRKSHPTGGRSMSFYASTRIEMSRGETIKRKARIIKPETGDEIEKQVVRGHRVMVRIDKEKSGGGRTGATATFVFDYEEGRIDPAEDIMFVGRQLEMIHKKGNSWWADGYEDEEQGSREKFRKWMNKNTAVRQDLEKRIREAF